MSHSLESLAPFPLELVWHENRSVYLSVKRSRKKVFLRLHRLFYDAPPPVLQAILRYCIRREGPDRAILKRAAHDYFLKAPIRLKSFQVQGTTYNVQEIFDRLLALCPLKEVSIGWSKRGKKGRGRSITFGSYVHSARQIWINPRLDDPEVPLYFLEFIVYHEMLHAFLGLELDSRGRCSIHTPAFRDWEKRFPEYRRAKEWEKGALAFFKKDRGDGRS